MTKGHCGRITRQDYAKGKGKNPCGKTVKVDNPYEVWINEPSGFEWRVLKTYQHPEKEADNLYARRFVAAKSPYTYDSWEYGDTYSTEILKYGKLKMADAEWKELYEPTT